MSLKELRGPCYDVSHAHHFDEIERQVKSLKQLAGPVYDVESGHHFNEIAQRIDSLKTLRKDTTYRLEK